MQGLANNEPDFIRLLNGKVSHGYLTLNGLLNPISKVEIGRAIYSRWLDPWAAKLGLAFWYHHSGIIFPEGGRVVVMWFTNDQIAQGLLPAEVQNGLPGSNYPSQGKLHFADQFWYQYGLGVDEGVASFLFYFHESSAVWVNLLVDAKKAEIFCSLAPSFMVSGTSGIMTVSEPLFYRD